MNERFDDMMRRRLEGHESETPDGLFDAIRNRPDVQDAFFDNAIRSKLTSTESPVPSGTFDAVGVNIDMAHLGFDSAIRGRLEIFDSAVSADMWQRITTEKDRRRRPVAWWWVAATTLLLLAGGVYSLLKKNIENTSQISAIKTKSGTPQSATYPKQLIVPASESTDGTIREENSKTDEAIARDEKTNSKISGVNKLQTTKLQTTIGTNSLHSNGPDFNSTSQKNISDEVAGSQATGSGEDFHDEQALTTLQASQFAERINARLTALSLIRNVDRLIPGQLLKAQPHAPVIPCPTNSDDKRNDWYIDVYGSAFLLQKTVQDNYLSKNAKAGFDSTLHQQASFNAGVNLVKSIGNNFLLKTGLQYNRINESFRLTQVNERRLVTTISVRTVIIAPGDTVYIRDTSVSEKIGTAQYRTQNRYTQWDIPVIIGYEFGGEALRLNANAGIIANIRSAYQGEMLADSTRKIFDINNYNGQPIYRKTVGFSLYAGLSIVKPLSERMNLLIEPHARIGLSNTANSNAWFNQKNSTMGLSIGLRYNFNGSRQQIY